MKNTVLRYGVYSAISLLILFIVGQFIGKYFGYSASEVFGYASILISLLFVFAGIKHYRDQVNNGVVSFAKGLVIGLMISLIASLAFGILDIIYIKYINPDFVNEYYAYSIEQLKLNLSGAELQEKLKEMEAQKEMFTNRFMSFIVMFMTVFVLGFIISLISALILQRK
ncbi:MAG: DUF4199 domain-containing protein [Bacteroidia bacterium]|nr:DUF4199 domain-containing protein [Bacteroidia bacterium]NND51617.1 DUF4199 domain-containing protein [Flavobacteriaceae bacterium]